MFVEPLVNDTCGWMSSVKFSTLPPWFTPLSVSVNIQTPNASWLM